MRNVMGRYFFHLHDGIDIPDTIGSEHPDLASVRAEAVESISERTRGRLLHTADTSAWLMNVTNEAGFTVMVVSLSAAVQVTISAEQQTE
jgi:hypothetical protein